MSVIEILYRVTMRGQLRRAVLQKHPANAAATALTRTSEVSSLCLSIDSCHCRITLLLESASEISDKLSHIYPNDLFRSTATPSSCPLRKSSRVVLLK